jgi:hypothetical protein
MTWPTPYPPRVVRPPVRTQLAAIALGLMAALQLVSAGLLVAGDVGAGPMADAPGQPRDAAALDIALHLGVTLVLVVLEVVAAVRLVRRARGAQPFALTISIIGGALWLCCGTVGIGGGAELGGTAGLALGLVAVALCLVGIGAAVLAVVCTLSADTRRYLTGG